MRTATDRLIAQLRKARSDMVDCLDPDVVEKYPHLGTPEALADAKSRVCALEGQLAAAEAAAAPPEAQA